MIATPRREAAGFAHAARALGLSRRCGSVRLGRYAAFRSRVRDVLAKACRSICSKSSRRRLRVKLIAYIGVQIDMLDDATYRSPRRAHGGSLWSWLSAPPPSSAMTS